MEEKITKCKIKNHDILPCWALDQTLEEHHRRKGISIMHSLI